MAPRTGATTISYMIDSNSEDEFQQNDGDMMLTPDSAVENHAPARRGRKPAPTTKASAPTVAATKGAKGRVAPRRASGNSVLGARKGAIAKKPRQKRAALAEKDNPNQSETEEVDEFDSNAEESTQIEPVPVAPPTKRGKSAKGKAQAAPKGKRGAATAAAATVTVEDAVNVKPAPKQRKGKTKVEPVVETLENIPETQPDSMDYEQTELPADMDIEQDPTPKRVARSQPRVESASRRQPMGIHRRAGSASDTERGANDPTLRRRLGDMTKKFESINIKYQNLREVGMQDKETNFDKLKKAADQRAKDQDQLIANLQRQLATQRALANESKSLQAQIQTMTTENTRLQGEVKSLNTSLQHAQNEAKTLSTKLAATRSSVQATESAKVPGSAVKQKTAMMGSADMAKEAQIRQLKEDLYSDLTGLIVRNVKRGEEDDIFDCIQTGRNGTLHFHLSIATDDASKAVGNSYEDAEFAYMPLLDQNRDRDLLEILPDYLTEEIYFPRSSAAKFYAKVVDCMTKRIVSDEE